MWNGYARWLLVSVAMMPGVMIATDAWAQTTHPVAQDPASMPFRNPALPLEKRLDDLIGRLTLEEKASQLVNQARAIPRLDIPEYDWWSEALHGVANNGFATVFPEPVGLAATFDTPAIQQMGHAIGVEGRVKWNQLERAGKPHHIMQGLTFWSPNINIFRDPRWGRGQETYGEDPFLSGTLGTAFVRGMQGDDPRYYLVSATAKHYAVHSGPEPGRHSDNVTVSLHDMEDTYLPAFRALVMQGKVESVMCAYNAINGQPACANTFLMKGRLRDAWGFKGHVVSDCDAIADIERGHHFVKTNAEAAAASLKVAVDNDCTEYGRMAGPTSDYDRYREAMQQGLVPMAVVDDTLRRLFRARMRLGLFDPADRVPFNTIPDSELNSPAHKALALKLARESMVLLKNDGTLPLAPGRVKRIAVVGPLADQVDYLSGNYHGTLLAPVSVLEGIRAHYPGAEVVFEPGTDFLRAASPVPGSALFTPEGQSGLKGEYFRNASLDGAPALTRIDAQVAFDRNTPAAIPDAPSVTARWTGAFAAPESGHYKVGLDGRGAKLFVDDALVVDGTNPQMRGAVTVDMDLTAGARHKLRIEIVGGRFPPRFVWTKVEADALGKAVKAAQNADVVVAVVGITSSLEGEEMPVNIPGFKGGDRTSTDLPAPEEEILKAVQATGKPLVVVLMSGSALSVNWAKDKANAILQAWYPGQEGGSAVAQTLAGANNPSGRLPVTIYTGVDQLPAFGDYAMTGRTYRYFTGKPLFPFGYGLSYTSFGYSAPQLSASTLRAGGALGVDATVTNTGALAGDEVVQLYLTFPKLPGAPLLALRGFERVHLAPGEARKVHFDLTPRDLSSVTEQGQRLVRAGAYRVSVGGGQPGMGGAGREAALTITGSSKLPE